MFRLSFSPPEPATLAGLLDDVLGLLSASRFTGFYPILRSNLAGKAFWKFCCRLLERSREASPRLARRVQSDLESHVKTAPNLSVEFQGLSQATAESTLREVKGLERRVQDEILGSIKNLSKGFEAFDQARVCNPVYQLCLQKLLGTRRDVYTRRVISSFEGLSVLEQKKAFLTHLLELDPVYPLDVLRQWFAAESVGARPRLLEAYCEVLFAAAEKSAQFFVVLEELLEYVLRDCSLAKAVANFDTFAQVLERNGSLQRVSSRLETRWADFLRELPACVEFHAWQERLETPAKSAFSKGFLRSLVRQFDERVERARLEANPAFEDKLNASRLQFSTEKRILSRFGALCKPGATGTRAPAQVSTQAPDLEHLVPLVKLTLDMECQAVFNCIQEALENNRDVGEFVSDSRTLQTLLALVGGIRAEQSSLQQLFLIKHFKLIELLKEGIAFEPQNIGSLEKGLGSQKDELSSLYKRTVRQMEVKLQMLQTQEKRLSALESDPRTLGLFEAGQIQELRSALASQLPRPPGAVRKPAVLHRLQDAALRKLASRVWRNCFVLFCIAEQFYGPLRGESPVSEELLRLLFELTRPSADCAAFEGFLRGEFQKGGRKLALEGFNRFAGKTQRLYERVLQSCAGTHDYREHSASPGDAPLPENLLLLECLTWGVGPGSPAKAFSLAETVRNLKHLRRVRAALGEFPAHLESPVQETLAQLDRFVSERGYKTRLCMAELCTRERALLGRIQRLVELIRDARLEGLFREEVLGELAAIGEDPFRSRDRSREIDPCAFDQPSFARLMAAPENRAQVRLFMCKIDQGRRSQARLRERLRSAEAEARAARLSRDRLRKSNEGLLALVAELVRIGGGCGR